MQPKTIMFRGNRLAVVYGRYANNRQAIRLVDAETGEPYLVATVNIPEVDIQEDEVLIKDYSENAGILPALESAGIVQSTDQLVATGYVHVTVCKLLVAKPEQADGDDEYEEACADDEDGAHCAHDWVYTGTAYGGDDESFRGEGRVICRLCGADGDA